MAFETPIAMQAGGGDPGIPYSALDVRRVAAMLITGEGVGGSGHLRVSQRGAGANFSVDVAAGFCAIQGDDTANQGMYICQSTSVVNIAIPTPGAGTRIHRIVAQVKDKLHNSTDWSTYEWAVECLPDTTGVTPPEPDSAITLALVTVAVAQANVSDANINGTMREVADVLNGTSQTEISLFRFADSSPKTNNTLADDSDLTGTVPAGVYYELTGQLIYSTRSDTDFKFRLVGPANATFDGKFSALLPSASGISGDVPHDREIINTDYVFGGEGANNTTYMVVGMSGIFYSGDGGTFKVQWAQNVTNATATYLRGKSFIQLRPVR